MNPNIKIVLWLLFIITASMFSIYFSLIGMVYNREVEKQFIIPQAEMTANRLFELGPMIEKKLISKTISEGNAVELDQERISFNWFEGKGMIIIESFKGKGHKIYSEKVYETKDLNGNPIIFRIEMNNGRLVAGCYKQ